MSVVDLDRPDAQPAASAPRGRRSLGEARRARAAENRTLTRLTLGTSRWARVLALVALVVLAAAWLVPLLWGLDTSFKTETDAASSATWVPPSGFTLEAYATVLARGDVLLWTWNTTVVAVAVTAITVLISAMAAYAFSRTLFRGRRALMALTVASILIPPQILIVPLFQQMQVFGLVDTLAAVILPQVVAPVMVFILKRFFDAIPEELLDAARIDGAGSWRLFWTIVMPLSRSILVAVAIFVFIGAWNNFLWPFIITNDPSLMTLPVGLATVKSAYGVQYAETMAAAMIAALPLLVVFMLFQRRIVQGVATTGMGGQ
ncbi:carbohydrate ABC transporter permease [Isoptericola cucumis]|uniref:Sugar ABC transporter permease n=1 Tax=Isoptericola cucumis TaxID=1776856 RepID=A0ABQ2B6V9_9MICO|nr:carbohydrate ABC transporter permease [Isoptericola cucumis]GGI09486.1 sugar ABC transporter permease [Isoptericola cucumis]